MARLLPIILLLLFISSILMMFGTVTSAGFHLELIHRFSRRSPLYPGKLTKSQLVQRLMDFSLPGTHHNYSQPNTTMIRPPLIERTAMYMVSPNIGTDRGQEAYYLVLDTGSGLTWTQCIPCDPCFPQSAFTFHPELSPSYIPLSCDDPLCVHPYQCHDGRCTYQVTYTDESVIRGVISRDTFKFHSSAGQQFESFPNLAFGE